MNTNRIGIVVVSIVALLAVAVIALNVQRAAALTSASSSTTTVQTTTASTTLPSAAPIVISQALPGQGSIVGGALLGSSTNATLPSFATTTAAASTTPGLGILSEHNKLGVSGSCVVKSSGNAKQCAIYVRYSTATGAPVLGVPVTIATMNAEGMFTDVDGPLLLRNVSGKVVQYSGILPGLAAQDVATYIGPATATSTLFVVLTPDGLRAQSTFASSTVVQ
jgi:hypothetical protein